MTSATPPGQKNNGRLGWAVGVLGSIIAPATLISSLMLYFGWVRTNALFGYFGVDPAILGFTLQDYGLRAAGIVFRPAIFVTAVAFILIGLGRLAVSTDRRLARYLSRRRPAREIQPILAIECALSIIIIGSTIQSLLAESSSVALTAFLGLGDPLAKAVGLTCAAVTLLHALQRLALRDRNSDGSSQFVRQSKAKAAASSYTMMRILACALAVLGIFWATAVKAQRDGYDLAEAINTYPGYQANVTLSSNGPLQALGNPSHQTTPDGKEMYRYPGLHLLSYAGGRWLLLTNSRAANGRLEVVIVRDGDIAGASVVGPS